jgi:hypothetical protein
MTATNVSNAGQPAEVTVARPPDGFRKATSVANAPWFNVKNGNVLQGILENMYERNDARVKTTDGSVGKSNFFQIKLTVPAECRYGIGDSAKLAMAPAGTVVNLNYSCKAREALEPLISSVAAGAEYEIWLRVDGEKFKIRNGTQMMWPIVIHTKVLKAAPVAEDDEVPDLDIGDQAF